MTRLLHLVFAVALALAPGCTSCYTNAPSNVADTTHSDGGVETDAPAPDGGSVDAPEGPDDISADAAPDVSDTGAVPDADGISDTGDASRDVDTGIDAVCGDDAVEPGEACDDGNTDDGDYCSSDCKSVTGSCGDGTLQSNESCDDGKITSNCDTYIDGGDGTCQPPGQCSSGYVYDGSKCVPKQNTDHVHISITNTCSLSVRPTEVTIRNGRSVKLTYHNHSSSYSADVVYSGGGGGYYDLMPGSSWTSPIDWCTNQNRPYTVDIEILVHGFPLNDPSCPGHEFKIHCKP